MRRTTLRISCWPLLALVLFVSRAGATDPPPAAPKVEAPPPLPAVPRLELPKPDPKDLEELDARLKALTSQDATERDTAARELLEVKARLVPAIAFRLQGVADRADKEAMKRLFSEIRDAARDRVRREQKSRGGSAEVETPDYLAMLVRERPKDKRAYDDLVRVVGMSRMLTQIGTVEAVRVLIEVYVRFGEFLRIHVQRELTTLGDRAVAALIEARRHPAEKIGTWARRQLDALGRAVPSEAVQIPDPASLADVLRAYGRVKDPDSARIVVSFANSERALIRDAARQAIVLMGEVSAWQLRDSYENTVGKRPPRDWSWERTARELFGEFDRMRARTVSKAYDEGKLAEARGDREAMRKAFDEVLAKDPNFERREELGKAYLDYAKEVLDAQPRPAQEALFRALRLSGSEAEKRRIESLLLTVRARLEMDEGLVDRTLLARALELDPENARARDLVAKLSRAEPDRSSERTRKLAASTIAVGALVALFVILRRRPEQDPEHEPAQEPRPAPPDSPS